MEKQDLVAVQNIKKSFGDNLVLKGISFELNSQEVVAFTGVNGAGKTTTIKILLGLESQSEGKVKFLINKKQDVGVMLQDVSVPENMQVIEWLTLINKYSIRPTKNLEDLLNEVGISKYKNYLCSELSGGNKRKLQFAAALVNHPKLIILDEPTVGLDYQSRKSFWNLVDKKVKDDQLSVLVVTHDINEIADFTDRLLLLSNGNLVLIKETSVIKADIDDSGKVKIARRADINRLKPLSLTWIGDDTIISDQLRSDVAKILDQGVSFVDISIEKKTFQQYIDEVIENE